jgi:hypothetical protein
MRKTRKMRKRPESIRLGLIPLLCMAIGVLGWEGFGRTAPLGIEMIDPTQIQVGSFFHGKDIRVRAIFPGDCQLALRILGSREDLRLMCKGRVGGIWMNTGEVTFSNIPRVYLLWTSGKPARPGELKFAYSSVLDDCLRGGRPKKEKQFLIDQLIRLKERDNLYAIKEGTIRTQPLEKGFFSQAEAVLHLPAKIYPGSYTLEFITFKEGKSTLLRSYPLNVRLSGLPAALSDLAHRDGLLYGLLAVGIAAFCGLVMGVFFSSRGGH